MRRAKKYEELVITDDFMFGKVMREPERCKKLLERVLGVRIRRIVLVEDQEVLNPDYEAKGIRLDIYVEDEEDSVYCVEMQTVNTGYLPKRTRYYQDVIDINLLEKGATYKKLKKNYIIFICTFDLFGQGRHIYHFENRCREDLNLCLNDETEKIFLNTKGTMDDVDEELKNLLVYFDNQVPADDFTREIADAVADAKEHKMWRKEYMKMTLWQQDIMDEAREEGLAEGRTKGLAEGLAEGRTKGLAEGRAEGLAEGLAEGRQKALAEAQAERKKGLIEQVCKKILKGKSREQAADELELDLKEIDAVYTVALECAPNYDVEKIYARYMEQQPS